MLKSLGSSPGPPDTIIPTGASTTRPGKPGRERNRKWLPEAYATTKTAFDLFKRTLDSHKPEIQIFGNFHSLFMGLVDAEGNWEHHGGKLRFSDSSRSVIADELDPQNYYEFIGEAVQPTSYLKSPYYIPLGFPDGMYRVGPLARLNVADHMGTPKAEVEFKNSRNSPRARRLRRSCITTRGSSRSWPVLSGSKLIWMTRNCSVMNSALMPALTASAEWA